MGKNFKKKIAFSLFWGFLIISFIFFAGLILIKANGWQFNLQRREFIKTGLITLSGRPTDAKIKINNRLTAYHLPAQIANLAAGYYDVAIEFNDRQPWQKTIQVVEGRASINQNIVLFYLNPREIEPSSSISAESIRQRPANPEITIVGSELYFRGRLVSRFASDILAAEVMPDEEHLVIQLGDETRVIEIEGTNNLLLFRLSSAEPTRFLFENNGRIIYYLDNNEVKAKEISD